MAHDPKENAMTLTDVPTTPAAELEAGKVIVSMTSNRHFWVGISTGDQDYVGGEDWEVTIQHVRIFDDMGRLQSSHPFATVSVRNIDRAKGDRLSAIGDYAGLLSDEAFRARRKAEEARREADALDAATNAAIEAMNL